MNKENLWTLFEKTGNIEAYMMYNNISNGSKADNREASVNAIENRRTDYKRYECR